MKTRDEMNIKTLSVIANLLDYLSVFLKGCEQNDEMYVVPEDKLDFIVGLSVIARKAINGEYGKDWCDKCSEHT